MFGSRMTLRQRYIAFGVVFAVLVVGAMIGLAFVLNNLGEGGGEAGAGVAPPPQVTVVGRRVNIVGESVELPNGTNGLQTSTKTYTLTAEPEIQGALAESHGSSIRVIGNIPARSPSLIVVNRFFDVSDPGAGPTPAKPRRLPPERPTQPDGTGVAQPGQPGTPGGVSVNKRGRPTGQRLPDVGQTVTVSGILRRSSDGGIILIDTRGNSHRIWGSPGMISRLRGLDGHRVDVTGNALLGNGSNANYTINATRVVDRGPANPPPSGGQSTPAPGGTTSTPTVIAPGGGAPPSAPAQPSLKLGFESGFDGGTTGWSRDCRPEAGVSRLRDAVACNGGGSPRIASVSDVLRTGRGSLRIITAPGDGAQVGAPEGVDESSISWSLGAGSTAGKIWEWKFAIRPDDATRDGAFAVWRAAACPDAPNPLRLEIDNGNLVIASAGGTCEAPRTNRRAVLDGGANWTVQPGVWQEITILIRWGAERGSVTISGGSSSWSSGEIPVGYAAPNDRVVFALGLIRSAALGSTGTLYVDDVTFRSS